MYQSLLPASFPRISDSTGTVMVVMPWVAGTLEVLYLSGYLSRLQVRYTADPPVVSPGFGGHTWVVVARALSSAAGSEAHVLVVS